VRSLDVDWPPHQPTSLLDLVAGARAVEWDFTHWCYVSGYDARRHAIAAHPITDKCCCEWACILATSSSMATTFTAME
jgi:hypothetical protein